MKKIHSMDELFLHGLKDLYDAEQQLVKALPDVAKHATSSELKSAFNSHLKQTKNHVKRLEQCFEILGEKPTSTKCKAMAGLIAEGEELMSHIEKGQILDAALIGAAQKVEHYEITSYGTIAEWAKNLNQTEIKNLLGATLEEERETDEKLSNLACDGINKSAREAA